MCHSEADPPRTSNMEEEKNHKFDPDKFVDCLLEEGLKIPCNSRVKSSKQLQLPNFYNEDLYKRGQKFFYNNIFALFFSKLLGLLTGLAIPTSRAILIHTNMSNSPLRAYKRYMATISHMCIWYQSDFTPGSKLWKSIMTVKNLHSNASKKCGTAGIQTISQRDMALAQFGFMGFAVTKKEKIGLYNVNQNDWRGFIHIWRVVGCVLGIEDRFNICRDSVEETVAICEKLINKIIGPSVANKENDFVVMSTHLLEGMWVMNPVLNTKVFLLFLHNLTQFDSKEKLYIKLNLMEKIQYFFIYCVVWSLRFNFSKNFHNFVQIWSLWLMKVFPFLAYYKYGFSNSHVVLPFDVKIN